jgi:hypothetical protein
VDVDPVAVAHGRAILEGNANAAAVRGDFRHPEEILADTRLTGLLDLDRRITTPMTMRSRGEVEALFAGFEPVSPGVVLSEVWCPDPGTTAQDPERIPLWVGAGRRA